jgi:hypothetical protein
MSERSERIMKPATYQVEVAPFGVPPAEGQDHVILRITPDVAQDIVTMLTIPNPGGKLTCLRVTGKVTREEPE